MYTLCLNVQMFRTVSNSHSKFKILKIGRKNTSDFVSYNYSVQNNTTTLSTLVVNSYQVVVDDLTPKNYPRRPSLGMILFDLGSTVPELDFSFCEVRIDRSKNGVGGWNQRTMTCNSSACKVNPSKNGVGESFNKKLKNESSEPGYLPHLHWNFQNGLSNIQFPNLSISNFTFLLKWPRIVRTSKDHFLISY